VLETLPELLGRVIDEIIFAVDTSRVYVPASEQALSPALRRGCAVRNRAIAAYFSGRASQRAAIKWGTWTNTAQVLVWRYENTTGLLAVDARATYRSSREPSGGNPKERLLFGFASLSGLQHAHARDRGQMIHSSNTLGDS
jgi:hypothetical protein